jgi:hypothetical protein
MIKNKSLRSFSACYAAARRLARSQICELRHTIAASLQFID